MKTGFITLIMKQKSGHEMETFQTNNIQHIKIYSFKQQGHDISTLIINGWIIMYNKWGILYKWMTKITFINDKMAREPLIKSVITVGQCCCSEGSNKMSKMFECHWKVSISYYVLPLNLILFFFSFLDVNPECKRGLVLWRELIQYISKHWWQMMGTYIAIWG